MQAVVHMAQHLNARIVLLAKQLTLSVNVKSCQKPAEVDLLLEILGLSFDQEINGNQEIPLPGASISELGGLFLTVKTEPKDDGDMIMNV